MKAGRCGVAGLNEFLGQSRNRLLSLANTPQSVAHVVMGNEASDMDSMVSSALHAYLRSFHGLPTQSKEHEFYVPVMNIPREDFSLRTEAAYLFDKVGVERGNLVFLDEVNMPALLEKKQLVLTMTDHNKLSPQQEIYSNVVVEIIDHHKDEKLYTNTTLRRVIEPVGSACTLVAQDILSSDAKDTILDAGTAHLLAGTILVDTVNLSSTAGRTTEKDIQTVVRLIEMFPDIDRESLFSTLQFEKYNVASLCTRDLLRKDYKEWDNLFEGGDSSKTPLKMGISSVGLSLDVWLKKEPHFFEELGRWMKERALNLLLCMIAFNEEHTGKFKRQLVVYVEDDIKENNLFQRFTDFVEGRTQSNSNKDIESFDLVPIPAETTPVDMSTLSPSARVSFYALNNAKVSRKVIQPVIMEGFFNTCTND